MIQNHGTAIWSDILGSILSDHQNEEIMQEREEGKNRQDEDKEPQKPGRWIVNKKYSDDLFLKLLAMSAAKTGVEVDELIENLGSHFIDYIR